MKSYHKLPWFKALVQDIAKFRCYIKCYVNTKVLSKYLKTYK